MEFGNPWAFLGLLVFPLIWWWGRARLRESRAWMSRVTLSLRGLFLLLLLAALSAPTLLLPERRTDWLFLIDRSHSVPPQALDRARALVVAANGSKASQDRIAVMSFGADSALDVTFGETVTDQPFGQSVDGGATHIENALQAALAEFEDRHRQRIVLLSDGNETAGDALNAVLPLVSRKIPVTAVAPPEDPGAGEVALENVIIPPVVRAGDKFATDVIVASAQPGEGILQVFQDNAPAGQFRVTLKPGRNVFPVDTVAGEEGQHLLRAVVSAKADRRAENNHFERYLNVEGGSKVLLIQGEGTDSRPLAKALGVQGLRVTVSPISGVPATAQGLLQYDLVVFDNAPGQTLSKAQMEMLEAYVRDYGGGFMMVGGDKSFGGGGYHETPLEAMLPVNMDIDTQVKLPAVALVLVIDRSDSMSASVGDQALGGTRLELAKLAAFSAMQLLNPTDRVGLVAFSTTAIWVVPMTEAGKREQIARQISALKPSGGTDLYVGLKAAVDHLARIRAHKKHIIALSDGLTPVRRFEELLTAAVDDRITVSTVALGEQADQYLMRDMAAWGGGRYYFTDDPLRIPRIFTPETTLVARGLVEERRFTPRLRRQHEILDGIDMAKMPPLYGFAVTSPKPGAEVLLTAPGDEPVLAVRQYGLGRTIAFTSDLTTAWAKDWVKWEEFPRLVTQVVRWAARRGDAGNLEVELRPRGESAEVIADLFDREGRFLNQFALQVKITYPDQTLRTVALAQEAPGRYRGEFPLARSGEYLLTVLGQRDGEQAGPKSVGLTVPYAAEYRYGPPNDALLTELTARTGGQFLRGEAVQSDLLALLNEEKGEVVRKPIWAYLIVAGILFFLIDIALRQLGWMPRQREDEEDAPRGPRGRALTLEEAVAQRAGRGPR